MIFAGRINRRRLHYQLRIVRMWRLKLFVWLEGSRLRRLMIGPRTVFNVLMRSWGTGFLQIGSGNEFGCLGSSLHGAGEILIQPRIMESEIIIGDFNAFNNGGFIGGESEHQAR